ncbi:hypothetical protein [Acinetobacter sp. 10FS3-1]|uniref:hypothetical protein n=1 Tax=Acinetobacter sp. 10FS3-1 TaxID=2563897 RepID=UPI00157D6A69|nr:hypothetical protein [Acinetobacter sp. 10FS3-1]MDM1781227.1 hypothetical protein [Acinetobacter indicus]QKQ70290.1 hypothetical protein E5Y90_08620 [Acinetobacter sp. 10FS3-1]
MTYSNEKIVKALLLAPIPLLFFTAWFFIMMNREYDLYSIFVVFIGHGLVYLAYCILTVPFSFLLSATLNRYNLLNLLTICISTLFIATPFFILFSWTHTSQIPEQWWKMYSNISTILMALFPGICYWVFLIGLKDKKTQRIKHTA